MLSTTFTSQADRGNLNSRREARGMFGVKSRRQTPSVGGSRLRFFDQQ